MDRSEFQRQLSDSLAKRGEALSLRVRQVADCRGSTHLTVDGKDFVNFASNNYLGLTHHPSVINAARDSLRQQGAGSGAAALVTGYSASHAAAEAAIAKLKGCESAVLLPSGYQANHAAIQTLAASGAGASGGVRFLVDKLAHASLIDALRASGAQFRVFPHNHLDKLERLLSQSPANQLQVVVTESIFSMDGDAADLRGIAGLKKKFPFVLLLDEAHGTGVYGNCGAGLAAELGLSDVVDISIVTLSKALGGIGGAVCGTALFCESVINFGRAYIYSTSVPAFVADAALAAIEVMRDEPERQLRVRQLARNVRERLSAGFEIPAGDSPIIPIILREEKAALAAALSLGENGLFTVAVRPPTVPKGTSRLRITLSCEHTDEEVGRLVRGLERLAVAEKRSDNAGKRSDKRSR
jgi:8-amino-7-oxononanoate synthase